MDATPNSPPPGLSPREKRAAQLCHLATVPKLLVQIGISVYAGLLMVTTWSASQTNPTGYEILGYAIVALFWPLILIASELLLGFLLPMGIRAIAWPKTAAETPFVDHYRRTTQRFHNRIAQRVTLATVIFLLLFAGWCGVLSRGSAGEVLEPTLIGLTAIALLLFGFMVVFQIAVMVRGLRHANRGDRYQPPWTA